MNKNFAGAGALPEPLVGDVYAVRTFRIRADGVLLPLNGNGNGKRTKIWASWRPGVNEAVCHALRDGDSRREGHSVPEESCMCGFYAYGDDQAAEYRQSRHVLGVIRCHGKTIVGTKGVRTSKAEVVALWLSAQVDENLVRLVAENYPQVKIFRDKGAMLAEFPPTALDEYETSTKFLSITQDERFRAAAILFAVTFAGSLAIDLFAKTFHPLTFCMAVAVPCALIRVRVRSFVAQSVAEIAGVTLFMLSSFALFHSGETAKILVDLSTVSLAAGWVSWSSLRSLRFRAEPYRGHD